jgi:Tfp pilus assembly protein PilN
MIRINLLGIPRPKKGKRAGAGAGMSMPSMSGEGGPGALVFVAAGLILGAGLWWFTSNQANKTAAEIATKTAAANAEGLRLADVKTKWEKRSEEAKTFEKRVKVIDQLRADQSGPVQLLSTVGSTVNNTDAVWLNTMTDNGNTINIDGMALSTHAVANLITNLKSSGYFKNVEIKDTVQDPNSKEIQAFTFTLSCERMPAETTKPGMPAASSAAPKS